VLVEYVSAALASVVDLVVFLRRRPSDRVVDEVVEVTGVDRGHFRVDSLYTRELRS
jgi:Flp pilus assembly CpaF family ATPase